MHVWCSYANRLKYGRNYIYIYVRDSEKYIRCYFIDQRWRGLFWCNLMVVMMVFDQPGSFCFCLWFTGLPAAASPLACSRRHRGHGRCIHPDRSPLRTEWPVNQSDTLLQTLSKTHRATNIWSGMRDTHSLWTGDQSDSPWKILWGIAVDQNNEHYLFPDVWSISTVEQITHNNQ